MRTMEETELVQEQVMARPYDQFPPSLWGDHFLSYVENQQEGELHAREIAELKEIVKRELLSKESSVMAKIILIDNIERLGLAYHFEEEIDEELKQIFHMNQGNEDHGDNDLFMVSLQFRILRQHGYNISSGVFQKFKDPKTGVFKESLKNDTRGLLSLHEAAYVRIKIDDILEEAFNFTTIHLKNFKENSTCPILEKDVEHALLQSLHRNVPRLEARHYISIFEQLDQKNESLLKLAKLDFNSLQSLHKQELCDLSRWWKKLDIITKLGYPRDRLVECYFFALATFYEPQYSVARSILTKVLAIGTVIDDTFDSYGSIPELQVFTDAVLKWNAKEIDHLPYYMKICYKILLDLFENFEEEFKDVGRTYAVTTMKESMKQLIQCYFIESKWFIEGQSPSFDEYLSNGLITSTFYLLVPTSYLGVKAATEEVFSWLSQNPQIFRPIAIIGRLVNDISSYKREKGRGHLTSPIAYYMKQFGIKEEEAVLRIKEIVEEAWKELNETCIKSTGMSRKVLGLIVNLARMCDVVYKYDEDGYTHPGKVHKYRIASLVVDPISI